MEAVLGLPEKKFETQALQDAYDKAVRNWRDAPRFGRVVLDPHIEARLNRFTKKSRRSLFNALSQMAFSGPSDYMKSDGSVAIIETPGGRRYSQREMAATANMSTQTAMPALKDLQKEGLLAYEASRYGTYVLIRDFGGLMNRHKWRAVVSAGLTQSRVSIPDTFLPDSTLFRDQDTTVDVPRSESRDKKVGDPLKYETVDGPDGVPMIRWL